MTKFTDLLDNYLLALGAFNQAYTLYEADPLRFGKEYRDTSTVLQAAKDDLNTFIGEMKSSIDGVTTP